MPEVRDQKQQARDRRNGAPAAVANADGSAAAEAGDVLAVETVDLVRAYKVGNNEVLALRGLSIDVKAGRWVGVKGRSGSGKTTLLNCVGGLDHPTNGVIRCFGREITRMSDSQLTAWRRKHIGFVFQSFALLPTLSAYENVELPLRIAGAHDRSARSKYCLDLVGLAKWAKHRPYEMSGGQNQRVAIARALANRPRLILADEPTGELDSTTGREILALFRRIVETEGITILMTSHDPIVLEYVDEVMELQDGQLANRWMN